MFGLVALGQSDDHVLHPVRVILVLLVHPDLELIGDLVGTVQRTDQSGAHSGRCFVRISQLYDCDANAARSVRHE